MKQIRAKPSLTLAQAKRIYIAAGGLDDHNEPEWNSVREEMEKLCCINPRSAHRVIGWWGCWDGDHTPAKFCRNVQAEYERILKRDWKEAYKQFYAETVD